MKKMTGAEYKAFMASDWDALLGLTNAYVDGQEVQVNGADEPSDMDSIPDTAKVVIVCGCIMADEDVDLSYEAAFTRWKKAKTHTTVVVQVPNDTLPLFNECMTRLKCKVLK